MEEPSTKNETIETDSKGARRDGGGFRSPVHLGSVWCYSLVFQISIPNLSRSSLFFLVFWPVVRAVERCCRFFMCFELP